MRNSDRLLKILITIATLIILSTLAVLAFHNFSSGDSKSGSRSQGTTTVRQITSTTESGSKSTTDETTEKLSNDVNSASPQTTGTTTTIATARTTQSKLTLEKAIEENANEERGERVEIAGKSKTFPTQAEAHAYGQSEVNKIAKQDSKRASYIVKAVRDENGKVTSWQTDITIEQ